MGSSAPVSILEFDYVFHGNENDGINENTGNLKAWGWITEQGKL